MYIPCKLIAEHDSRIIAVAHDKKIRDRFDRVFYLRDEQLDGPEEAPE